MRLIGVATMLTIALIATVVPIQAQENRATERAEQQARDAVREADQALKEAENPAKQEDKDEAKEKGVRETTAVTILENGGISTGDAVLLAIGGSTLVVGAWFFARRQRP